MTDDDLTLYERLAQSAGLIQVFDGHEWLDLRLVIKAIINETRHERALANRLTEQIVELQTQLDTLNTHLDEAHHEVTTLSTLLRGE